METGNKKVIVVMPAYNAEKTLCTTYNDLPMEIVDDIILTDDCSTDRTVEIASKLPIKVFVHNKNRGYGGNQKTCYKEALKLGADITVMVHPDHQYDPRAIPRLIEPLLRDECDAVFGSRMLGGKFLEGGMPKWKFYANIFLTSVTNIVLNLFFTEIHSGFRAYSRKYLQSVNFLKNSDNFIFDTEIIIQGVEKGMKIVEIPIQTRYFDEASQINFKNSLIYGFSILLTLIKYKMYKWKIKNFEIFS